MFKASPPWYRRSRDMWYTTLDGKQVPLGISGIGNEHLAQEALKKLLIGIFAAGTMPPVEPTAPSPVPLQASVEAFLARVKARVRPHTYTVYRQHLLRLIDYFGAGADVRTLTVDQVQASARRSTWSKSTQHGYLGTVSMFLTDAGHALRLRRPRKESRGSKAMWTDRELWAMYGAATGDLKPLILVLLQTGARPGEASGMTVEGIDWEHSLYQPEWHKNADKDKPRVIHFTEATLTVLKGQRMKYASGHLFRQEDDRPFSVHSLCERVKRTRKRAGIDRPIGLYGLRHGYVTKALETGLSAEQVGELVGNSPAIIMRHYSHLGANAAFLKELAAKVRPAG